MDMFYTVLFCILGAGALATAVKASLSKSFFDRALMVNAFTSYAIAFTIALGLEGDTGFYADIAMVFALIGFISMVAVLRYVRHCCLKEARGGRG